MQRTLRNRTPCYRLHRLIPSTFSSVMIMYYEVVSVYFGGGLSSPLFGNLIRCLPRKLEFFGFSNRQPDWVMGKQQTPSQRKQRESHLELGFQRRWQRRGTVGGERSNKTRFPEWHMSISACKQAPDLSEADVLRQAEGGSPGVPFYFAGNGWHLEARISCVQEAVSERGHLPDCWIRQDLDND